MLVAPFFQHIVQIVDVAVGVLPRHLPLVGSCRARMPVIQVEVELVRYVLERRPDRRLDLVTHYLTELVSG